MEGTMKIHCIFATKKHVQTQLMVKPLSFFMAFVLMVGGLNVQMLIGLEIGSPSTFNLLTEDLYMNPCIMLGMGKDSMV